MQVFIYLFYPLLPFSSAHKTGAGLIIVAFAAGLLFLSAGLLRAESRIAPPDSINEELIVKKIRFAGNSAVNDDNLESLIRTKTNREFFGIRNITPWYFLWKINKSWGEPPAWLDREVVGRDLERIGAYYESLGYRSVQVDSNIIEYKPGRVEVSFIIKEGPLSKLKKVSYTGLPENLSVSERERFYNESQLTGSPVNDTLYNTNRPFRYDILNNERNRIISFLKKRGYAAIQKDSVIALVQSIDADKNNYHVLFNINPGQQYTFGDVIINLSNPDNSLNFENNDTLASDKDHPGKGSVIIQKGSSTKTRSSFLKNQLLFDPGDQFNNELYQKTINEFQNLQMMTVRRFGLSRDGGLPDYSRDTLPVMFELQTLPRHQLNYELFGMRRFGYGAGAGITYTNNNLNGGGEVLQVNLNGSFELPPNDLSGFADRRILRSYQSQVTYTLPRLTAPFSVLDDFMFFSNAQTSYSISYSQANQNNYDINADIQFNLQYQVRHSNNRSSFLDLVKLDWLDTTPTDDFEETLDQQFPDSLSLTRRRIEEDFRPQFSSSIRYTYRNANTDLIKRNKGHFTELSFTVGGNIPYLIDRHISTPDTLESKLPSIFSLSTNKLSYSQYFKVSADYRNYTSLSSESVWAYRLFAGYAHPYGKNDIIPLNRRFFAGGSNDIRGYAPYSLGPGSIPEGEVVINGGEIKLAGFMEWRNYFIKDFLNTDYIFAAFADAGNIWYGPRNQLNGDSANPQLKDGRFYFDEFYKQMAVSSGFGIRLDWEYVIFRFDFAYRIHDLQQGWFNNSDPYFTFGIGHSF